MPNCDGVTVAGSSVSLNVSSTVVALVASAETSDGGVVSTSKALLRAPGVPGTPSVAASASAQFDGSLDGPSGSRRSTATSEPPQAPGV